MCIGVIPPIPTQQRNYMIYTIYSPLYEGAGEVCAKVRIKWHTSKRKSIFLCSSLLYITKTGAA